MSQERGMTDLVIGSGPAGAAASAALLARGRSVIMIDAGETLEAQRQSLRGKLERSAPEDWAAADLKEYKAPLPGLPGGALSRFGSDYFVRDREGLFAPAPDWLALRPSYARGGLSNAWGAAVLPYRQEDLKGWPIGADDLEPHYRALAGLIPIAGQADDLQALFPAQDVAGFTPLKLSAQAEGLLARLQRRKASLSAGGVHFGRARVGAANDCRNCGLCLVGCPYGAIFNAATIVDRLAPNPAFEYRPGLRAERFSEGADGVELTCRLADGQVETIKGERLFIAAGVLPTAQLVLASTVGAGREVMLLDSQQLFLPSLHLWQAPRDPVAEPRHALTQIFIEMLDPAISPWTVHSQLYTYNELYAEEMKGRYGRSRLLAPLFEALSRRLIVAQLFLHSDHSHRIGLTLASDGRRLEARLAENAAMAAVAGAARAKLALAMISAGMAPLTPVSRLGQPGSSFHCGGTFPMRKAPAALETDALGRISGLERVHIVDASVLPSIPATTITLSVMANAHRIASQASA